MLKASDILAAQVVVQLGLAEPEPTRAQLLDIDLGESQPWRDLVNRLGDRGQLDPETVELVRHRVALYEHVWSEDCYLRHLESRCKIPKAVVVDLLIELEKHAYRERVGQELVNAKKLDPQLDRSIAIQAMHSLERQLEQFVRYHRERDFAEVSQPLIAGSDLAPEAFRISTLFRSKQTIALVDQRRLAELRRDAIEDTRIDEAPPTSDTAVEGGPRTSGTTRIEGNEDLIESEVQLEPDIEDIPVPPVRSRVETRDYGPPNAAIASPAPGKDETRINLPRPEDLRDPVRAETRPSRTTSGRLRSAGLSSLEHVGEYDIIEVLGSGGMGAVFLAKSVGTGEFCAVKVLAQVDASAVEVGRFQREIELTSRIEHPNVIGILDHGETQEGLRYLVVPALFGKELRHYLKATGDGLPPAMTVRVLDQILAGLQAVHDNGVVHRDLKPENVFVLAGANQELKLLDFGVAKLTDEAYRDESSFRTTGREIVGTPAYMSPDAVTNDKLDGRTDIYSLGVMLHEMLTGELPLASATPEGWIGQHLICPPRRLSKARPDRDWPDGLEELLLSMLGKTKNKRPESCQAIVDELDGGLRDALLAMDAPAEAKQVTEAIRKDESAGYRGLLGRLLG